MWVRRTTVIVPLLVTIFFVCLAVKNPPVVDEYIEGLLTDYRFKIRNFISQPVVPDNILIVTIDEKSLSRYGRWPWNRELQAELILKVFEGGPRVVGVDIFYPEPETPGSDRVIADVFRTYKDRLVIALGFEIENGKKHEGETGDVFFDLAIPKIENLKYLKSAEAFRALLPPGPIAEAATFGHVYSLPDRDGKLRWDSLYIKYGDEYLPSLALQTARIAMGVRSDSIVIRGGEGVMLGRNFIPTDEFGRLHINYIGREGTITHKSAADVLSGDVLPEIFLDRTVLIGTSAISTYDMKNTPFSANMPGVEKNATIIANILRNDYIKKAPLYTDIFAVMLVGMLTLLIGNRHRAIYSSTIFAVLTAVMLVSNQTAFAYGLRVNLIYPLVTLLVNATFIINYKYFIEERKARDIRKMFSSYVTERVVNELIRNPEMAKLGGERREITVLFSDISGFTSFSEEHEPEEVVAMLNEYLGAMTEVIFRWEGTLDKFIGDAIVAFWGAPMKQDNHAELAVRCSLHMIKRLEELQEKWVSEGKTSLSTGIGLNTGEVIVGNIGAEGKKMDYTVIGDHVNIGARVESLTRKFNTNILITELPLKKIMELVKSSRIGHVSIKGMGNVVVKGKARPIKVYEIKSLDPSAESIIDECEDETVLHLKEK